MKGLKLDHLGTFVNVADLGNILVATPPRQIQRDEYEATSDSFDRADQAIATVKRAINLARERRAALISAAVTGKIDVGVAA